MELIGTLLKALPGLAKAKVSSWMVVFLIASVSVGTNIDDISGYLFQEDIAKKYIEKTFIVERDLNFIRQMYKADVVTICLIHNGVSTISNLHLMRYTLVFGNGPRHEITKDKMVYVNMPLSPWIRNCQQMILKGHYYMKDVSISDDPLESSLFEMTGKHTFLYLPLYSKENALIGFLTISYKKVTNISQKNIDKAYRSIEIVEAHLND